MKTLEEDYYFRQLNWKFKRLAVRFIIFSWATILVLNLLALGVIYWTLQRNWFKTAVAELETEPVLSDCRQVCLPTCGNFLNTPLAKPAGQRK